MDIEMELCSPVLTPKSPVAAVDVYCQGVCDCRSIEVVYIEPICEMLAGVVFARPACFSVRLVDHVSRYLVTVE